MKLSLINAAAGYDGHPLLSPINCTLTDGHLIALIGRNGTGKSTIMRSMAGLLPLCSGHIEIDGQDPMLLSYAERAKLISIVTTTRTRVEGINVEEVIALGRSPYTDWRGTLSTDDHRIINQALETVGMKGYEGRELTTLSDGEYQRIMIARALAQDTPILLLDEPTSFLDLPNRYDVALLLRQLAHQKQRCVIFSTHELDIALRLCDDIMLIDPPALTIMPTTEMISSGRLETIFSSSAVGYDAETQNIIFKEEETPSY